MEGMCDGGREREGIELVEYCEMRFLDACDRECLKVDGPDVTKGGSDGRSWCWVERAAEASAVEGVDDVMEEGSAMIGNWPTGAGTSRRDEGPSRSAAMRAARSAAPT